MLALGIVLVVVGFLMLPRGGIGGPARDSHADLDLQGLHPAGGSRRGPERARSVTRGLLALAVVAVGVICIGAGS